MTMNKAALSATVRAAARRTLFAAALAFALAAGATERSVSQDEATRGLVVRQSGAIQYLTAECAGEARPDRVVIFGAMTAEAVKPLDAQAQLDRQLTELRKFVDEQNGRLDVLERVRAARTMSARRSSGRETPPFLALQRLEIEFPVTIDVDAMFERVLYFGLDRFGPNIRVDRVDRKRHIAVRYRFSALVDELDRLHDRCRAQAIARWCANEGAGLAVCALPAGEHDARVRTQALNLRTQRLLNDRGNVTTFHVSYPWRSEQTAGIEPVGNIAVEFKGTIQLQIADVEP